MGILHNKTRVIDTIITDEGKKQIAAGGLKLKWITFTDAATFYRGDLTSGSADATVRMYLESNQLPQDQICFKSDDSGKLSPFKNDKKIKVLNGKIFKESLTITGSFENDLTVASNNEFASLAGTLLSSSLDNFKKLYPISTVDEIFDDNQFDVGPSQLEFVITDDNPIKGAARSHVNNINYLDSFFQDPNLSHVKNFKFLPPIQKLQDKKKDPKSIEQTKDIRIGEYIPYGPIESLSYEDLKEELSSLEKTGNCRTVKFNPTSRKNNIGMQFFEIRKNEILKLDVIDFGSYKDSENLSDKHVFFIGKVMLDDNDSHTFIHLFTIVLE